jgi:hypothetical protein
MRAVVGEEPPEHRLCADPRRDGQGRCGGLGGR